MQQEVYLGGSPVSPQPRSLLILPGSYFAESRMGMGPCTWGHSGCFGAGGRRVREPRVPDWNDDRPPLEQIASIPPTEAGAQAIRVKRGSNQSGPEWPDSDNGAAGEPGAVQSRGRFDTSEKGLPGKFPRTLVAHWVLGSRTCRFR